MNKAESHRRPPSASLFAIFVAAVALFIAIGATPNQADGKMNAVQGAPAARTAPIRVEAGKSKVGAPKHSAVSRKPAASAQKNDNERFTSLKPREVFLIQCGVIGLTALGVLVSLNPVIFYVWIGWAWREHSITTSLTTKGKCLYLAFYHQDVDDDSTADDRFKQFYNKWFGRSRLVIPALILGAIVVVYSFFLACCAAQAIYGVSLVYLPLGRHVVKIAIAAVAGSYTMVTFDTITRVVRRDLLAEDLYVFALRWVACVPIAYSLSSMVPGDWAMIVAFGVSTLSLQVVAEILRKRISGLLGVKSADPKTDDPVTLLSGVDPTVADRMASIGITTIWQLAESDPVQLAMRTNLTFNYLLELTSQAIAWTYLERRLEELRSMALGGAYELGVLNSEANKTTSIHHDNAIELRKQAADKLKMSIEQFKNVLHEIGDDPRTEFLIEANTALPRKTKEA